MINGLFGVNLSVSSLILVITCFVERFSKIPSYQINSIKKMVHGAIQCSTKLYMIDNISHFN